MHYYQDLKGGLHFLEDARHLYLLPDGALEISAADFAKVTAQHLIDSEPTLRDQAQAQLSKLTAPGGTVMRCYMAGIAFPADWQAYRTELLAIANGTDTTSTALPTQPSYPAGT
ncbi:MAG: hypothetical protein WBL62_06675 [Gallionella sp.]